MTETVETRRLSLRPLELSDAKLFARLFGDDRDAVAMTTTLPNPCTEEEARKWIERRVAGNGDGFAIHRRKDGLFIGAIGYSGTPDLVELGFGIGRPFWGRGYATEAVRAIVDHVWDLGIGSIEACTFKTNPASARVLEKCGFEDLGRTTRNYPQRGGQRSVHRHLLEMEEADIVAE
ncbi:MAG: GNAT family N-acetyltransferase [Rhodospirillales bacterium]|nr:GNAT family N-acetyltransferase [Rhodospirillales bacterium]